MQKPVVQRILFSLLAFFVQATFVAGVEINGVRAQYSPVGQPEIILVRPLVLPFEVAFSDGRMLLHRNRLISMETLSKRVQSLNNMDVVIELHFSSHNWALPEIPDVIRRLNCHFQRQGIGTSARIIVVLE